jgi:DNA-binding transcriptional MerR regulator
LIRAVAAGDKAAGAFRTIGEVSKDTGLPQHILRYWETRFPQLRPLQRAGKRRYYRPEDVALVRRINELLNQQGYTVRGVQKLLMTEARSAPAPTAAGPVAGAPVEATSLRAVRDLLASALAAD